jgi:hypothetical protein
VLGRELFVILGVPALSPWCTFIPSLLPLTPLVKSERVTEKPLHALGRDDPAVEVATPPPWLGWTQHNTNARPVQLQHHRHGPLLKPQCMQCVSYSTTHHNGARTSISLLLRPSTRLGGITNQQPDIPTLQYHLRCHRHRMSRL